MLKKGDRFFGFSIDPKLFVVQRNKPEFKGPWISEIDTIKPGVKRIVLEQTCLLEEFSLLKREKIKRELDRFLKKAPTGELRGITDTLVLYKFDASLWYSNIGVVFVDYLRYRMIEEIAKKEKVKVDVAALIYKGMARKTALEAVTKYEAIMASKEYHAGNVYLREYCYYEITKIYAAWKKYGDLLLDALDYYGSIGADRMYFGDFLISVPRSVVSDKRFQAVWREILEDIISGGYSLDIDELTFKYLSSVAGDDIRKWKLLLYANMDSDGKRDDTEEDGVLSIKTYPYKYQVVPRYDLEESKRKLKKEYAKIDYFKNKIAYKYAIELKNGIETELYTLYLLNDGNNEKDYVKKLSKRRYKFLKHIVGVCRIDNDICCKSYKYQLAYKITFGFTKKQFDKFAKYLGARAYDLGKLVVDYKKIPESKVLKYLEAAQKGKLDKLIEKIREKSR